MNLPAEGPDEFGDEIIFRLIVSFVVLESIGGLMIDLLHQMHEIIHCCSYVVRFLCKHDK